MAKPQLDPHGTAPRRAHFTRWAAAVAALAGASSAGAEQISVVLSGSYINTIVSAGETVPYTSLRPGFSAGPVKLDHPRATTVRSADGRNLESYFIRNGTPGDWEVVLGDWSPGAGNAADFFLFEVKGSTFDAVTVRPKFPDGSTGNPVALSGWSNTGMNVEGGPNAGQGVFGLGFRFEDLRGANGAPLAPGTVVTWLLFDAPHIDVASFLIREPGVNAPSAGDGSWLLKPATPTALSPVELSFSGPWASETSNNPNPFLDLKLTVRFDGPGGRTFNVPGYFDADGLRGDAGNRWAVRFLPPVRGAWTATASMRRGTNVAIDLNPSAGQAIAPLDGLVVPFNVSKITSEARGFYRTGTLQDVGKHYRKFEFGPYYLKAGVNGPENFLGLTCIDDVTKSGGEGLLHSYAPHVADWRSGDPILDRGNSSDDGRGVIGALNYLEEAGVNSLFLMVMNLGGDGEDTYPFLGPKRRAFEKTHYDTSRLRQWNTIFEHAQRCGISLSLVMNETEIDNELWLDDGNLGVERKLFYRELVARFGHHPAIRWNLCEESDFSLSQLDQFAAWVKAHDADKHAVAIHNNPNDLALFQSLATNTNFDAASLQFEPNGADSQVEQVRRWTEQAGKPWIVDADEQGPWQTGLTAQNATDTRKRIMYDALFSGGGVEFYLGYHDLPLGGDLNLEDFRTRANMWQSVKHARSFMEGHLPFWDMSPMDDLVRNENGAFGGAEVFALPGEVYAIYYPNASTTGEINLEGYGREFRLEWFNPRNGAFEGGTQILGTGGGWKNVPTAPNTANEDWIALVRPRKPMIRSRSSASVSQSERQNLQIEAGSSFAGREYILLSNFTGTSDGFVLGGLHVPINFDRVTRFGILDAQGQIFGNSRGVLDANGAASMHVQLSPQFTSGLVGYTLHHTVITLSPYDYVSNVVTLQVLP